MCSIRILKARKTAELMGARREEVAVGGGWPRTGELWVFFSFFFFCFKIKKMRLILKNK